MVRKPSGKWRMCTDYNDLNKACLKDPYPLPSIDKLVDGVAGFALLSFMDAYSSYNQIRMHTQDEEKTTFITDADAFYYKVMSFGLKNTGVTYQRLMDKIFMEVMGVDVEVYLDDMVVKSKEAGKHYDALGRIFDILRKHQLRLNLEKCSFGVHAGKFLGFMLTKRGIEANLEKCRVVVDMRSPQSVREVQQLMGRVTALSQFISRAAEMALPIFGTLKKGRSFVWTPECEEAFLRLKVMLATPLVLTLPDPGNLLFLYISVSDTTISVVLVQEREGEQRPVYFTSKVLQGVERRYQKIEKAALALVITSRRLRPRTNGSPHLSSIAQARPGRENGSLEYQVVKGSYEGTSSGRFYYRADTRWYSDGRGRGMVPLSGWVIESSREWSQGVLVEQSLHFEFKASNNQAEYEALLADMRLARELEARRLVAKSDSRLVTAQVNGEYQARDPQLTKYWERAVKMASTFEYFTLIHVPWDQNELADLLAKLAST
ncbi:Retrovirus-related Pol polyprotein from transposon 17.6, partial [Mucuna pruriens]